MNKINPKAAGITRTTPIEPDVKSKIASQKKDVAKEGGFNDILSGKLGPSPGETPAQKPSFLPEIENTFRAGQLSRVSQLQPGPDQGQLMKRLEASLELFETYAALLEDPGKTLKQAGGFLEQLSERTGILEKEAEEIPGMDKETADILKQLLTLVKVEEIKFNRGDYLN